METTGAAPLPADQISDDLHVDTDCSGGQTSMTLRNQSRLLGDFTQGRMRLARLTSGQDPASRAGKIPLVVLKGVKLPPGIATKEKRSTGWLKGLAGAAIKGKATWLKCRREVQRTETKMTAHNIALAIWRQRNIIFNFLPAMGTGVLTDGSLNALQRCGGKLSQQGYRINYLH